MRSYTQTEIDCCAIDTDKLIALRKEKKLSQTALANKLGIYQRTISFIESKKSKDPSFWIVCKIAKFFKIPVEELRIN